MITARSESRGSVLVVDDSRAMSQLLFNIFCKDFHVFTFSNALQAFAHLKYQGTPDILITDYLMPGMDGYEFIKNIRSNGLIPGIPIFMLTGAAPADIPKDLHHYDVREVIHKPFDPKYLLERMFKEIDSIKV